MLVQVHLGERDNVPLARLRIERDIRVLHLPSPERTGFNTPASNGPFEVVDAREHGHVREGQIPAVARRHARRAEELSLHTLGREREVEVAAVETVLPLELLVELEDRGGSGVGVLDGAGAAAGGDGRAGEFDSDGTFA